MTTSQDSRCEWAINFGGTLHTRCMLDADHAEPKHTGRGLKQFDYQRIHWIAGQDRREYRTDRNDEYAWDGPAGELHDGAWRYPPDWRETP